MSLVHAGGTHIILRENSTQIESHVWGLKSLGVALESYGSLLSSVLLNKLPQELQLIISQKTTDDSWSLDHLMKELEQELEASERAATNPNQPGKQVRDQPTAAALQLPNFVVVIASKLTPLACVLS